MRALYWLRFDLRLADNPALTAAAKANALLPIFIWDTTDPRHGPAGLGGASRWWLHHSLTQLNRHLPLTLLKGDPATLLPQLIAEHQITDVYWNRSYTPHRVEQDAFLEKNLPVPVHTFGANLLHEPWAIQTKTGTPYTVFTPYWNAARKQPVPEPLPAPHLPSIFPPGPQRGSNALQTWQLLPQKPNWAKDFSPLWQPGEQGAHARLAAFLADGLEAYDTERDFPAKSRISGLSPHLHWGELSPRQLWHTTQEYVLTYQRVTKGSDKFLSEVGWRDFCAQLLYYHPTLPEKNLKSQFDNYPWRRNDAWLSAWQRGQTGYPLVDAGMRELWHTGFMHNRVRMVVSSFLIKHLGIHWQEGERWFWDTLVDADLASNVANWQWVAGCGADAAPFFRIFNPTAQAEKFDPTGAYIRRWVPEIAKLPTPVLFAPWQAKPAQLQAAGIVLGQTYPHPLVDHAIARETALTNYKSL